MLYQGDGLVEPSQAGSKRWQVATLYWHEASETKGDKRMTEIMCSQNWQIMTIHHNSSNCLLDCAVGGYNCHPKRDSLHCCHRIIASRFVLHAYLDNQKVTDYNYDIVQSRLLDVWRFNMWRPVCDQNVICNCHHLLFDRSAYLWRIKEFEKGAYGERGVWNYNGGLGSGGFVPSGLQLGQSPW